MYNIVLRLFDVVFTMDGLCDKNDDDDTGFEVGNDEDDVVNYEGEDHENNDDDVDIKNDGGDDEADFVKKEDDEDNDVSSLIVESKNVI